MKSPCQRMNQLLGMRQQVADILLIVMILLVSVVFSTQSVQAQRLKVLHSFSGVNGDGANVWSTLLSDHKGNFYGTTYSGGTGDHGVVFKVTKRGKLTVLYKFTGGKDGGNPESSLIQDADGNLFGTTIFGGALSACGGLGCGVVFELDPSGRETVLYRFTDGTDGALPFQGVVSDGQGTLYGTTLAGGDLRCNPPYGCGAVFKLDKSGKETALYSFHGGKTGSFPEAPVTLDARGNLYGTTFYGGIGKCNDGSETGCGVVFKLDKTGKETVLHSFTGTRGDGAWPWAALLIDTRGNLYGSTQAGGNLQDCGEGLGVERCSKYPQRVKKPCSTGSLANPEMVKLQTAFSPVTLPVTSTAQHQVQTTPEGATAQSLS